MRAILRKTIVAVGCFLGTFLTTTAQIQEREWLRVFNDLLDSIGVINDAVFTPEGDVIIVGTKLVGFNSNIMVRKLSGTDGSVIWEYTAGGIGDDAATRVAVAQDGSIFVVGEFESMVFFDPPLNTVSIDVSGFGRAMFILKLNADGSFRDVKHVRGISLSSRVYANDIELQGNTLFVGGNVNGGSVIFNWEGIGTPLFFSGNRIGFVIAAGEDLSFYWAKALGGTAGNDVFVSSLTTYNGEVYVTGGFSGNNVDFEVISLSSGGSGSYSRWVAKIDANGSVVWAGSFAKGLGSRFDIAFDAQGKLWLAGRITGSNVDINPDPAGTYVVSTVDNAGILFSIDPATGALASMPSPYLIDGSGHQRITRVAFGPTGEIFLRGVFQRNNFDFDPSPAFYNPYSSLSSSIEGIFIAKLYEANGVLYLQYVRGLLGIPYASSIVGIAFAQQNDKVLIAENLSSATVDFDPTLSGEDIRSGRAFVYLQKPLARHDFIVLDNDRGNEISGAQVEIESEKITTNADGRAIFALPSGTYNYKVTGPVGSDYIPFLGTLTAVAPSNSIKQEDVRLCLLKAPSFDLYVENHEKADAIVHVAGAACDYTVDKYLVEVSETPSFVGVQTIEATNDPTREPTVVPLSSLPLRPDTQYYVRLKAQNIAEGKTSGYTQPKAFIYTERPTGVEDGVFARLFPVPTSERLYVELLRPAYALRLFDVSGRERLSQELRGVSRWEIDLSSLPQGVYFVEIRFEEQPPLVKKVLKW